jgi:hypothetical protein
MRLLVFLHGTVLMHAGGVGVARAERVAQVRAHHPTVGDYGAYVPVGGAVAKLRRWQDAGAVVDYLSSHRDPNDVTLDALVACSALLSPLLPKPLNHCPSLGLTDLG